MQIFSLQTLSTIKLLCNCFSANSRAFVILQVEAVGFNTLFVGMNELLGFGTHTCTLYKEWNHWHSGFENG